MQVKGQKKQVGWFPKDYVKLLPSGGAKGGERSSTPASELSESPRARETAASPVPAQPAAPVATPTAPVATPAAHQGKCGQAVYSLVSNPYASTCEFKLQDCNGHIRTLLNVLYVLTVWMLFCFFLAEVLAFIGVNV